MKKLRYQALIVALGMFTAACGSGTKKVDVCALFSNPLAHGDEELEITALFSLSFEESQLWCDQFEPTSDMMGIWIDWDREAIKKESPEFSRVLEEAMAKAARWNGGLSGTMRFRGRFEISQIIIKTGPEGIPRRMGFGHLGAFGFRVIVQEVLEFRPNQPLQRNAGSRPSSDDSPASETSSSLGPRG